MSADRNKFMLPPDVLPRYNALVKIFSLKAEALGRSNAIRLSLGSARHDHSP
jgi:hypothetical protein